MHAVRRLLLFLLAGNFCRNGIFPGAEVLLRAYALRGAFMLPEPFPREGCIIQASLPDSVEPAVLASVQELVALNLYLLGCRAGQAVLRYGLVV